LKEKIFITGGCKSGKSGCALSLAENMPEKNRIFIATCIPEDEEMKQRVARHQKERHPSWKTLEVPIQIPETIIKKSNSQTILIVDCLTLWMNNLSMNGNVEDISADHVPALVDAVRAAKGRVIIVSNEVGTGIVPANPAARLFRDIAGIANQKVAAVSDRVIWMVAGIPVKVKGSSTAT